MTAVTVARDTRAARIDNLARPLAQKGEIVVAVRKFSFTANNITYALAGDTLGYFDFYPCADEGRAMVPTWGTAEVVDSNVPGVAIGQGIYGFLPCGCVCEWILNPLPSSFASPNSPCARLKPLKVRTFESRSGSSQA